MIVSHFEPNGLSIWYYGENMELMFSCMLANSTEWCNPVYSTFLNMTQLRKAFKSNHDVIIHDDGEE